MKLNFIKQNNNKHLVILVHGLRGGDKTFFNSMQNESFHEHLNARVLTNIDIALLEYHTEIVSKNTFKSLWDSSLIYNLSVDELSLNAMNTIERVSSDYDSINYICHSMGGLVIKGALISSNILQNKVRFYFTLATPHRGTNKKTKIDALNKIIKNWNRQIKALEENSEIIKKLTHQYQAIQDKFDAFYYWASEDTWVLPLDNAFPVMEIHKSLPVICTHTEIAKPTRNFYYEHFIQDINKRIENALALNNFVNNQNINETVEHRLDTIESKIDILLHSSSPDILSGKQSQLDTEFIDIEQGYIIKDAILHESTYYILLTKHNRSKNIVVKYIPKKGFDSRFASNGLFELELGSNNSNMNKLLISDDYLLIVGESIQNNDFNITLSKVSLSGTSISNYFIKQEDTHIYANDALVLDNGNIITCGANFQSKKIFIAAIDKNGNLSKDFGNNGIIEENYSTNNNWANCICKYDNNSFLVAGRTNDWEIFISKFKNNGEKIIEDFSPDGKFLYKNFLRVEDLKVQSDGKILIAGVGNEGRIIRLLPNGEIDLSFATEGILEVITNERSEILTLELFEDNSFIVGGFEYDGNSYHNAIFACYTSDGKLDTHRINNGFQAFQITNKTTLHKIFIHSKDKLDFLCNYNVDYSSNSRVKTSITHYLLSE